MAMRDYGIVFCKELGVLFGGFGWKILGVESNTDCARNIEQNSEAWHLSINFLRASENVVMGKS